VKRFWFDTLLAPARLKLFVWLSLVTQVLIVVTGGLVRLTGSGLGCPTWPKCTDDSLVSTQEMGIHGIIEFGNRLLTFVLLIVALLTFATIYRQSAVKAELAPVLTAFFSSVALLVVGLALSASGITPLSLALLGFAGLGALLFAGVFVFRANAAERKGLLVPAFGLGFGIILQAVVGGITVLTELNSWIVGLHFVISGVLISMASVLVARARMNFSAPVSAVSRALSWPTVAAGTVTVFVGVLVTGAGPHAGDALTPRNGLDLELWQHLHSYPGYIMLALIVGQLAFQLRHSPGLFQTLPNRILTLLLAASVAQAIVGVIQARTGVPEFLVAIHMLGAAVLCSLITFQLLALRQRR
jgi:cytochrome c oxidase assembly protein subunit 15